MRTTWWIWALIALLGLGYALPYTLLAGVERWTGTFLFWTLFGVAVWAVLVAAVSRWNDDVPPLTPDGAARTGPGGEA